MFDSISTTEEIKIIILGVLRCRDYLWKRKTTSIVSKLDIRCRYECEGQQMGVIGVFSPTCCVKYFFCSNLSIKNAYDNVVPASITTHWAYDAESTLLQRHVPSGNEPGR